MKALSDHCKAPCTLGGVSHSTRISGIIYTRPWGRGGTTEMQIFILYTLRMCQGWNWSFEKLSSKQMSSVPRCFSGWHGHSVETWSISLISLICMFFNTWQMSLFRLTSSINILLHSFWLPRFMLNWCPELLILLEVDRSFFFLFFFFLLEHLITVL